MNEKDYSDFCKKDFQDNDEKEPSIHDEEEPAGTGGQDQIEEEEEEEEEREEWEEEEEEEEKGLDHSESVEDQKQEMTGSEEERAIENEQEEVKKPEEPTRTAPETVKIEHEHAQMPPEQEEGVTEQEQDQVLQTERSEDRVEDGQVKVEEEKERAEEKEEELKIVHEQEVEVAKQEEVKQIDVIEIREEKAEEKRRDAAEEESDSLEAIDLKKEVERAERTIRKYIRETPAEYSPFFSQTGDCKVYLKLENLQLTGSFKLRGIMNKLLSLSKKERKTMLITASSGNHGAAFAHGVKKLGLRGIIYLPGHTSQAKIDALKYYDVVLKFFGTDCVKTEEHAIKEAVKNNFKYIPPYNDLKIIGGHGTIGIELKRQVERIDAVLVPVGGGGLISGIGGYLKSLDEKIQIIGCQPENSAVMYESIKAGKILEMESRPTISDGSAGGIEQGSITFDICKKFVDDFILVSEAEIKEAMKLMLEKHFMLIEGAGALSVASFLKKKVRFNGKNVVLIISGSKLTLDTLKEVLLSGTEENA